MWSVSEFRSELCGNIIDTMEKMFSLEIFNDAVSGLTEELSANENVAQNSTDINADLQVLRKNMVL